MSLYAGQLVIKDNFGPILSLKTVDEYILNCFKSLNSWYCSFTQVLLKLERIVHLFGSIFSCRYGIVVSRTVYVTLTQNKVQRLHSGLQRSMSVFTTVCLTDVFLMALRQQSSSVTQKN